VGVSYRVLVTGSRDWMDRQAVADALIAVEMGAWCHPSFGRFVLVHGGAKGLDAMAAEWAEQRQGWAVEAHPADWRTHGRRAGPIRNAHMVSLGAGLCLGFPMPGRRGTWDCIKKACDAGIPIRVVCPRAVTMRS